MTKKIILIILTIVFISFTRVSANNKVSSLAENWFANYSNKITKKYPLEKGINYFEGFSDKLNKISTKKNLTKTQVVLINDLIKLSNEYIFNKKLYLIEKENKKIINSNHLVRNFQNKSFNNENIFLENGIWYTYVYKTHLYFDSSNDNLSKSTLDGNNINKYNSLVFIKDNNKFGFVNNYIKRKLISNDIIYGISGKYNFLKELKDDKKELNYETDKLFSLLKEKSLSLTKGKTEKEKIKILYNYVISNISYSQNFSLNQAEVFSGIHTFANKEGVCEGYVKLFLYMLNFANIYKSEVIRGYVLDAADFPQIGHAWIKIGNKYYDPTFDDPIGQITTKQFSEYNYFGLPYDLFYTNRFTFEKIPSFLKSKSLEYRKDFIQKRTTSLLNKYKNSGFNLLKPFLFKQKYGIKLDENINISDITKILPLYTVNNWTFYKNGIKNSITNFKYYNINNENINGILNQLNYNLNGYYFFKWKLDNGKYEYRLAYDLKIKY